MKMPAEASFRDWSYDVYARPGVEPALLHLQDGFQFNVNLVLWALWSACFFEEPSEEQLITAHGRLEDFHIKVTGGLRAVRRAMKSLPAPQSVSNEIPALRESIKLLELRAEEIEQRILQNFTDSHLVKADSGPDMELTKARARRNLYHHAAVIGAAQKEGFSATLLERLITLILGDASPAKLKEGHFDG